jgi:hypothetical protein
MESARPPKDGHIFLEETAKLIRRGWCQGADARDSSGRAVQASDPTATSWSLPGAFAVVLGLPGADIAALKDAMWKVSGVIADPSLQDWNDVPGRTQAETLQMLARAASKTDNHPLPDAPSTG